MENLETKNLRIRKFKERDTEDVHNNLATEQELINCSDYHIHKNIEETRIMVLSFIKEHEMNELVWAIEEKKTGEVIGYINALEFSRANKLCEIKFGIGFKWLGKGYIEEALKETLRYLFEEEGFNIIIAKFYDSDEKVTKSKSNALESVGMTKEAILRNRKINEKNGKQEDKIVYSILKEEFENIK